MNSKPIKTYEDLEQEEQRLTAHLTMLKTQIKEDMTSVKTGIKDKLNPIKRAKEKVSHLFSQEGRNGPALNFLINFVLDFIIRKIIPRRTSIWTKTVIPFITKNYVSHLITEEQRNSILGAVNSVAGKIDAFIRKTIRKKQEDHFKATTTTAAPADTTPGAAFTM
jgi:hypothetical protein